MTKAEAYFNQLTNEVPDVKEGKMFGALCMKTPNGKAAAMFWKDNIVVKLQGEALKDAMALDGSQLFEPMEGRPMKEWVQIPFEYKSKWKKFALISAEGVKVLEKKEKKPKKKKNDLLKLSTSNTMAKNDPIVIEKTYKASVKDVWKAITDIKLMKEWYFDMENFKLEVGAEFQFKGGTEEKEYIHLCKIKEIVPQKIFSHTWRFKGYEGNSLLTFELSGNETSTHVKLTHEGLETFPASNPDFAKENFVQGWNEIMGTSLKNFLEK